MDVDDPIVVTRTLTLDASPEEVWQLVTDDEELSGWFAGTATLDVVPGGIGHFDDGTTLRRAVVHSVEHGRRLGFTWWDEANPTDASTVELRVDDTAAEGRVQLTVTETLVPASGGLGERTCSWSDAADSWDERLRALADRVPMRSSLFAR